jgi:hypothetical protein
MYSFIFILLFGNFASASLVDNRGFNPHWNNKLSAFWGHEFVGADLANEELFPYLDQLQTVLVATQEEVNLEEVPDGILSEELIDRKMHLHSSATRNSGLDLKSGEHGTRVMSIHSNAFSTGVALTAKYVGIGAGKNSSEISQFADLIVERKVRLVHASHTMPRVDMKEFLKTISSAGVILVRSSGNEFPESWSNGLGLESEIKVGNLSYWGGMDATSTEFKDVTISAPGINYSTAHGKTEPFGGTSGAVPLVSGCISNALSLIPDLTSKEVRILLLKTAIPTLNFEDEIKLNGAGTLNCYKLIAVVLRLRESWPESRDQISKDSLIYDFSRKIEEYLNQTHEDLSSCDQECKFKALRKAFLLDPHNQTLALKLATTYNELGYTGNALLYESMIGFDRSRLEEFLAKSKTEDPGEGLRKKHRFSLFRLVGRVYPKILGDLLMNDSLDREDYYHALSSYLCCSQDKEELQKLFLDRFKKGRVGYGFVERYINLGFSGVPVLNICRQELAVESRYSDFKLPCLIAALATFRQDPNIAAEFIDEQLSNMEFKNYTKSIILNRDSIDGMIDFNFAISEISKNSQWAHEEKIEFEEYLEFMNRYI